MTGVPRHEFEASNTSKLVTNPDISVGIVTYNHEKFLAQAIESVLAQQTERSFEIVIYEDCSKDRTREIALEYQKRHPEIIRVLYSSANVGVGQNVRRGIAACRGRYIAGVDGDDFWTDPHKLQLQFEALEAHPGVNVCFSTGIKLHEDGTEEPAWDYGSDDRVISQRELLRAAGIIAPSGSMFYRAHILHESPDWVYSAPVIDLFHLLAGTSPAGGYYLARRTVAYRVMARGSWSGQNAADYHKVKVDHSTRMLESFRRAIDDFNIPVRSLRFQTSLPNYVLGRDAFESRRYGAALRFFRRVGWRFVWLQLASLPRKWRDRKDS